MTPTIICLTPVRNEAWVLDRFLKATSLWADYIIIADQMSTDGSREIALNYPKVRLIDNNSLEFNELGRKRLLIDEARKICGPKLLITLDADEMFSSEIFTSGEWDEILKLTPGTAINFQWSNFSPDGKTMWKGYYFPWGYMDDGFDNYDQGISLNAIHCARVPILNDTPSYDVKTFSVIHFQYTSWRRMLHKHYYYQCLEVINNPMKSAVDIYRQYHHMDNITNDQLLPIPTEWINWYKYRGIDILEVIETEVYWYDKEVLALFDKYGVRRFRKVYIWTVNWTEIANKMPNNTDIYEDPRNVKDKLIQRWLQYSQNKLNRRRYRRVDKLLKKMEIIDKIK